MFSVSMIQHKWRVYFLSVRSIWDAIYNQPHTRSYTFNQKFETFLHPLWTRTKKIANYIKNFGKIHFQVQVTRIQRLCGNFKFSEAVIWLYFVKKNCFKKFFQKSSNFLEAHLNPPTICHGSYVLKVVQYFRKNNPIIDA